MNTMAKTKNCDRTTNAITNNGVGRKGKVMTQADTLWKGGDLNFWRREQVRGQEQQIQ